jgi:nucleoside-diphosphate-sugar epimerase
MTRRFLVVGGTGYLGRHVVQQLASHGHDVVVLARRAQGAQVAAGVRTVQGDVLTPEGRTTAVAVNADVLVQAAWETTHGEFWSSPSNLAWAAATLELARAFVASGGARVVGVGSCAEHGWPYVPSASPAADGRSSPPASLYGRTKRAVAEMLEHFCREQGASFAWPRVFFSFGEGEDPRRLVPSLLGELRAGRQPGLRTPGARRDLLPVESIGEAVATAAASDATGSFDVGAGRAVSLGEVAAALSEGVRGRRVLLPHDDEEVQHDVVEADVHTLIDVVGHRPPTDVLPFLRRYAATTDA